eukprot:302813_1
MRRTRSQRDDATRSLKNSGRRKRNARKTNPSSRQKHSKRRRKDVTSVGSGRISDDENINSSQRPDQRIRGSKKSKIDLITCTLCKALISSKTSLAVHMAIHTRKPVTRKCQKSKKPKIRWEYHQGVDSVGNDIGNFPALSATKLKQKCLEMGAEGFNTSGWVKSKLLPEKQWNWWTKTKKHGLWVLHIDSGDHSAPSTSKLSNGCTKSCKPQISDAHPNSPDSTTASLSPPSKIEVPRNLSGLPASTVVPLQRLANEHSLHSLKAIGTVSMSITSNLKSKSASPPKVHNKDQSSGESVPVISSSSQPSDLAKKTLNIETLNIECASKVMPTYSSLASHSANHDSSELRPTATVSSSSRSVQKSAVKIVSNSDKSDHICNTVAFKISTGSKKSLKIQSYSPIDKNQ